MSSHQSSEAPYRTSGDLTPGRRLAVLQDLGDSIPEVPVEWLLDNIIPRIHFDNMAVKECLLRQGYIKNGRWSDFPEDPVVSKSVEGKPLKPLETVVRNIIKCADVKSHARRLTFFDNPHHAPHSYRSNDTLPDGYFVRPRDPKHPDVSRHSRSEAPLHHWHDIALSAEYTKGSSEADRDDNVQKIVWSMHHVMRNDPCRRFTFGITVENTQMRIWFACRSQVFVTTAFHFIQDHEKLIHFVVSCTYATDVDLGWDPTIEHVYVNGAVQYDITVHDVQGGNTDGVVFRTTRVLADFGADSLRGRGTRVFEARRWDGETPDNTLVAVKDVWVNIDCDREGNIRQELEHDARDEDKTKVQKYFMTVLHHGDVIIDNQTDTTLNPISHGSDVSFDSRFKLMMKAMTNRRKSNTGATSSGLSLARAHDTNAQYQHKAHYRIVYKEVAEPVHSVTELATFFQALEDATIGLQLLHEYGWVHRDVSSGNLLFYQGGGKLSDLEYTKRISTESSHDTRVGTIEFMSLEVEAQTYLFQGSSRIKDPDALMISLPSIPFRYNPLHDLESLWWIGIWMMFYHRISAAEQSDEEWQAALAQQRIHQAIFPGILHASSRSYAFMQEQYLLERLRHLPPSSHAAAIQLEVARRVLARSYRMAEAGPTIDATAFTGVHQLFIAAFHTAKEKSREIRLRSLASILREPKRARQDEQDNLGEGSKNGHVIKKART